MKKNSFFVSALLGCFLLAGPALAQDKSVKLTTNKTAGETITLMVNHSKGITVDWGDGQPVTYNPEKKDGFCSIEGTVKGEVITITGKNTWNTLGCSNCGITSIDLSNAKTLQSLYCDNNALSSLDLRGMTQLADLDCSNNQIKELVFNSTSASEIAKDLASIENFNISNNQLSGTYYMKLPTLQTINASNNQYNKFFVYDDDLRSVNCSNNELAGFISLSKCPKLSNVICFNNDFTGISFSNEGASVKQVVCDDNAIGKMDLGKAEELKDLSCANNEMKDLTIHEKSKLNSYKASGNRLTLKALPQKRYAPDNMAFEPQLPFDIAGTEGFLKKNDIPYAPVSDSWSDRQMVNFKEACSVAGGRFDAKEQCFAINEDGTETELSRRSTSSGDEDYYFLSGKFAFFRPYKKAYIALTSKSYGYTIKSIPFAIGDDVTAVESVTDNSGLNIYTANGEIVLNSSAATQVHIYTIDGKNVWHGQVNGTENVRLPKGVYVVNGKKIIL